MHKTYMYIKSQRNRVCRLVKTMHTNLFAKKLQDMHHHKTYMYINFQPNRVNRSVITVQTILLAKKSQVA